MTNSIETVSTQWLGERVCGRIVAPDTPGPHHLISETKSILSNRRLELNFTPEQAADSYPPTVEENHLEISW